MSSTSSFWWLPETLLHYKCLRTPGAWGLTTVYPETFGEWPQTQHRHQAWICIKLMNTTCLYRHFPKNLPHATYHMRLFRDWAQQIAGRWWCLWPLLSCPRQPALVCSLPLLHAPNTGGYKLWITVKLLTGSPTLVKGTIWHWSALESLLEAPEPTHPEGDLGPQ